MKGKNTLKKRSNLIGGLIGILLLIPFFGMAQLNITLQNEMDDKPLAFAPMKWKIKNEGPVFYSQTDENGQLKIFTNGILPVYIWVTYLGFEPLDTAISADAILSLKPDYKYLAEAVVTDQYRATNPDKSINKVTIIDEKKMKAMAAVNVGDVLSNQLNVKLGQDNLLGSTMSLMGISGQNVKILMDGVPIIGRQNGNIDLSQININDVERIEIIEGPLSVSYGTNALAGAINIITKKKQLHKVELNTGLYYESIGRYNVTMNLGLRKTNGVYHISLGRNYFDGWSEVKHVRYQDWKPKEQYFGRFQYLRKIGLFDLNLKTEVLNEKLSNKGLPRMPYQETAFDEYYYTRRIDNSITATSKLPHNRYLNLIAAYNIYSRTKNRYLFNRVTLDKELVPDYNEQDTSTFRALVFRGTFTKSMLNSKFNYQVGYDINSETGQGKKIDGRSAVITDYATFLSMEIGNSNNFVVKPGVRLAVNTAYATIPLPSLNVKYNRSGYTIRTSYARGFRAPDLKELYLYFVDVNHNITGNPELKPEESHNIQMSVVKKFIVKNTLLQPEVALFYNKIEERIILTNIKDLSYTYQNLDFFKSFNANTTLGYKTGQVSAGIGYALNMISTENSLFSKGFTNHEVTMNMSYTLKKYGLTSSVFCKSTSAIKTFQLNETGGLNESRMEGYTWLDVTVSKSLMKEKWIVGAGVKNIMGITNLQSSGNGGGAHNISQNATQFAAGRVFFIKLDYNLTRK